MLQLVLQGTFVLCSITAKHLLGLFFFNFFFTASYLSIARNRRYYLKELWGKLEPRSRKDVFVCMYTRRTSERVSSTGEKENILRLL